MTDPVAAAHAKLTLQAGLKTQELVGSDHPEQVRKAIAIHNQTVAAANSFHALFCERHEGGKPADDHYEQDLLRAMILFSCSGLDATVKQLVRDSLESVIERDEGAQGQFSTFIERRLKRGATDDVERSGTGQTGPDYGLLANILANPRPREVLVDALVESLTANSMQSRDQLLKAAAQFALTRDDVLADDGVTQAAFKARNQLAHEMDIDFRGDNQRRARSYADMVHWSENILQVGCQFIERVSAKLGSVGSPSIG